MLYYTHQNLLVVKPVLTGLVRRWEGDRFRFTAVPTMAAESEVPQL